MGHENSSDRQDAGEFLFPTRALEAIEQQTYDILFPPLEGEKYVPMGPMSDPGAAATTYRQFRRTGLAKLVTEQGDDLPTAGFSLQEFSHPFRMLGISYQYNLEELRAAQFASRNGAPISVDMERATAAYEAMLRAIDVVYALGSATSSSIPGLSVGIGPDLGLTGLLNQPSAATYTPGTGAAGSTAWALKTPDEKIADLTGLYASQVAGTYKVHKPDTILLPISQFEIANGTRMGDGSDETVISFFKKIKPGITIDSWQYCASAGANGGDRAVAFSKNARFVRMMMARNWTVEPPQYINLYAKVLATVKLAGVICPYPLSITYMDGI